MKEPDNALLFVLLDTMDIIKYVILLVQLSIRLCSLMTQQTFVLKGVRMELMVTFQPENVFKFAP